MRFIHQHDQMDCGPACLAMVANHYGKEYSLNTLREVSFLAKDGVSLLSLSDASEAIGLDPFAAQMSIAQLEVAAPQLPCILHWEKEHFVVLVSVRRSLISKKIKFKVADPSHGIIEISKERFCSSWLGDMDKGVALFLEPTDEFYKKTVHKEKSISLSYIANYLHPFKKQIGYIFLLLLLGSLLTLVLPFLTQNLIDKGINGKDMNIISVILLAQLSIYAGTLVFEIIRNWLMLYVGTKLSIRIISDFLKRLLQLPIKYFDTKVLGDFSQRIQDNERIESFLTSQSLITFFSVITFSVFFGVLWYYNFKILLVYLLLTVVAISWSFFWLKKRKVLDYFKFQHRSENQESIYEIISGVTEMKLNQFEDFKRKEWENIQEKLFKTNIRVLKIDQLQLSGFEFLNQIKNILVTFLAATFVIKGKMTLGELLSVSYIVGQMNSPVNQLVSFFRGLQDARLSLQRLNEVQNHPTEEQATDRPLADGDESGISLKKVAFQYEGPKSPYVLKKINVNIPSGKVTAIVGSSGSGKTTLMKLLLKFYEPSIGEIFYNGQELKNISAKKLRENCGVVLQDGFIFSDTIERNIATGDTPINQEKLLDAVKVANIEGFIESLPLKFKTKIGASGNGLSGGQRQRILIARAVYKNPQFIFFDEATSALDAENEKIIHDNLQSFFKGKTVIVIAHRLSTVKNADNIIVLKDGKLIEEGNHVSLVQRREDYFNLVRNQLELGN